MAETINKTTLASKIAASTDLSQAKVSAVLDALFDEVSTAVAAGDKVSIPGFFSAERTETSARTGRNPQTGEEIQIAAGHRVIESALRLGGSVGTPAGAVVGVGGQIAERLQHVGLGHVGQPERAHSRRVHHPPTGRRKLERDG